jgi:hypothetical protein
MVYLFLSSQPEMSSSQRAYIRMNGIENKRNLILDPIEKQLRIMATRRVNKTKKLFFLFVFLVDVGDPRLYRLVPESIFTSFGTPR